jgi:hypothetical protein
MVPMKLQEIVCSVVMQHGKEAGQDTEHSKTGWVGIWE